jgi:phosphoglucomutase
MESDILKRATQWSEDSTIELPLRQEIQTLINQNNIKELTERFHKDLEFGTGGMRSFYQAGTNRINSVTIRRAAHAVALAVKEAYPNDDLRITLSFDSRHGSKELTEEAALIFAAHGITALMYSRINPVPLLSWSIRYHKAHAGVMLTASHNPKEYNGLKVFWTEGAQVTPPHDHTIINFYNKVQSLAEIPRITLEDAKASEKLIIVNTDVEEAYQQMLLKAAINPKLCRDKGSELKIVFTPIHGTAYIPAKTALEYLGFSKVLIPKEQALPDGDFPTVKSPNPENPSALSMAVELMKQTQSDIVFGSDPDGDRLGIALLHQGEVVYPNGNQIGALMLYYLLENKKKLGTLNPSSYIVKSIVTTPLLEKIATAYDVECFNTLTGFKWICSKMNETEKLSPEKTFLFATEESFGYLHHPHVRDKDGIGSITLAAEMTLWYREMGMNLIEALDHIYERFGYSFETLLSLDYFGLEGAEKINRIMETFRNLPSVEFAAQRIVESQDYQRSIQLNLVTNTKSTLHHPKSNVLGFLFENGDILFLRPSGTEPKIKFYIMIHEAQGTLKEKKSASKKRADIFLEAIQKIAQEA